MKYIPYVKTCTYHLLYTVYIIMIRFPMQLFEWSYKALAVKTHTGFG